MRNVSKHTIYFKATDTTAKKIQCCSLTSNKDRNKAVAYIIGEIASVVPSNDNHRRWPKRGTISVLNVHFVLCQVQYWLFCKIYSFIRPLSTFLYSKILFKTVNTNKWCWTYDSFGRQSKINGSFSFSAYPGLRLAQLLDLTRTMEMCNGHHHPHYLFKFSYNEKLSFISSAVPTSSSLGWH